MRIGAFGDSNVNIFQGLNYNRHVISIYKFKGVNIKSLLNKSDSYKKITNILSNKKYDICFFVFGNVDVNFYYYYKKYNFNESNIFEKMKKHIKDYVNLIKNLPNIKIPIIINIQVPSIIDSLDFKQSLSNYNTLDVNVNVSNDDLAYENRLNRVIILNNLLKINCKKYNLKFCDISKYCLDKNNVIIKFLTCLHNKCNIHPNFENILIIYLNFCLSFLFKLKKFPSYNEILNNLKHFQYDSYIKRLHDKYPDKKSNINEMIFNKEEIQKYINKIKKIYSIKV